MNCATCGVVIGGMGASTPEQNALNRAKELGLEFKEPICNDCFRPFRAQLEVTAPAKEHVGYCTGCGVELPDGAAFCPKCGLKNEYPQMSQSADGIVYAAKQADEANFGFALLSFILPIVGLVLYAVWSDRYPLKAKSCGKGALLGFIGGCLLVFLISTSAAKEQESALQQYNREIEKIEREHQRIREINRNLDRIERDMQRARQRTIYP